MMKKINEMVLIYRIHKTRRCKLEVVHVDRIWEEATS